jgi:hypothetical protein
LIKKENSSVRTIRSIAFSSASFSVFFLSAVVQAHAQSFDAYFGVGTAQDKAANLSSDTFGDGTLYGGTRMGGLFGTYGGDFMFSKHFGVGAESSFRFSQGDYAGLGYRPTFYDFNGVWLPLSGSRRVVPEIQAGVGGANLSYYESSTYCDQFVGCSTSNQLLESSHHFQVHFGAGVRIYAVGGLYVRPQFDVHWVNNFYQFGSGWVPEYSAVVGYSFGHGK